MKTLLLHICCAPCAMAITTELAEKFDITFFWYNPNIAPDEEYKLRYESAKKYALALGVKFLEVHENLNFSVKQCDNCYNLRLQKLAEYAKDFDFFTTSLLSSPYQQHEYIKSKLCADKKFYYIDGRKNYYAGKNSARAGGYYLQKYCGCYPSKLEREQK